MPTIFTPTMQIAGGVPNPYARVTLFDTVSLAAGTNIDSRVVDCSGYREALLDVYLAGFAVNTDLIANLAILHGLDDDIANLLPLPFTAALNITSGALTSGLAVDSGSDGIDIANTFQADTRLLFKFGGPISPLPPRLAARVARTSGGTAATIRAVMHLR